MSRSEDLSYGLIHRIAGNRPPPPPESASFEEEIIEAPTLDLRSYFPETWLFDLTDLDNNGNYELDINAPDTVTTWVGEAFCTSDETGLIGK